MSNGGTLLGRNQRTPGPGSHVIGLLLCAQCPHREVGWVYLTPQQTRMVVVDERQSYAAMLRSLGLDPHRNRSGYVMFAIGDLPHEVSVRCRKHGWRRATSEAIREASHGRPTRPRVVTV